MLHVHCCFSPIDTNITAILSPKWIVLHAADKKQTWRNARRCTATVFVDVCLGREVDFAHISQDRLVMKSEFQAREAGP